MSSAIEPLLVKAYAKKQGIPDVQAEAIIEAMKEEFGPEGFQKWISTLSLNAETLMKLPPDLRQGMTNLITAQTVGAASGGGDVDAFAQKMAIIRSMLKDETKPPGTDPELRKQIDALQQMVAEMKDEKTKKEYEAWTQGLIERLEKMDEKITAVATPQQSEDSVDKLAKDAESVTNRFAKLKELLGIKDQPAQTPLDVEGMKKELAIRGYKVEGPKTPEELEKYFNEKLAETRKLVKEETLKEIKSDERKMGMLVDLGTSMIESVIPILGKGGSTKGLEIASKALQTAKEGV